MSGQPRTRRPRGHAGSCSATVNGLQTRVPDPDADAERACATDQAVRVSDRRAHLTQNGRPRTHPGPAGRNLGGSGRTDWRSSAEPPANRRSGATRLPGNGTLARGRAASGVPRDVLVGRARLSPGLRDPGEDRRASTQVMLRRHFVLGCRGGRSTGRSWAVSGPSEDGPGR